MSSKLSFTPAAASEYAAVLQQAEIALAPANVINAAVPAPTLDIK